MPGGSVHTVSGTGDVTGGLALAVQHTVPLELAGNLWSFHRLSTHSEAAVHAVFFAREVPGGFCNLQARHPTELAEGGARRTETCTENILGLIDSP